MHATTRSSGRGRRLFLVLAIYIVLALLVTWPLALSFTTHVPGDGIDDPSLAWNLWWIRDRLVNQANPDIFHTGWMFHPVQINLAFYTLTPLNGLISIPLQYGLSLVVASNLGLLSSFVLGAFGLYLLVRDQRWWTRRPDEPSTDESLWFFGALVAGVLYGFASSKLFYASLGQFNIASSQWIPFCMLYLVRAVRPTIGRREGMRYAVMAALFFAFQLWAEFTYASFLALFVVLLFVWRLLIGPRRTVQEWIAVLLPFALFGSLVLLALLPFAWAMAPDLRAEGDFFASGGGFADIFSADLVGYLLPTRLHPLMGEWVASLPFPNDKGQHIFIGYTALILGGLGLWSLARDRQTRALAWLWGASLLLFFLLTLGPTVRWQGTDTHLPGPFALISQLPLFSGNRYPSRYSVMLMATVAVLGGHGMVWLLSIVWKAARKGRPSAAALRVTGAAAILVCGVYLFEHLSAPLPLSDFRVPEIYERLAQEEGDFAILELPTGWRNGARVMGRSDLLIMLQQWWQTEHGKRRLGGNTSRNPEYKFQYFTQAPLLGELIALMNADRPHIGAEIDATYDDMVAHVRPVAGRVLDELGIKYVLVHEDDATPQLLSFVSDVLPLLEVDRWSGTDREGAPSTIVRYRVQTEGLQPTRTLSLSDSMSPLFLGEGWTFTPSGDGIRYATRPEAVLLVDLPDAGAQLRFESPGTTPPARVAVNGKSLATEQSGAGHVEADLPPEVADQPVDRIVLSFDEEPQPAGDLAQLPAGARLPIGATGASLPGGAWVVVRSAGEEVGDFAHIWVNGHEVALGQRGYNLAALNADGQVLDSVVFDTSGDPAASRAMAEWLRQWPAGTIIAGAVNDDGSLELTSEAVAALNEIGVARDLRDRLRWSHAFVGAVGASTGSAVEDAQLIRPAEVWLGAPVDGRVVFGGLSSLTIQENQ